MNAYPNLPLEIKTFWNLGKNNKYLKVFILNYSFDL